MAGTSMSAHALEPVPSSRFASRFAGSTRTRRNHGVFLVGYELATVYSSRREGDALGVTLSIGVGSMVLTGGMTPDQARAMAKALNKAAAASDATGGAQ